MNGVIRGKMIELENDPGIGDGQHVEVIVRPTSPHVGNDGAPRTAAGMLADLPDEEPAWGEGLRRCAGALADSPEMDQYLEEILRERKRATRREVPE
jgi:hypothetical protein